MKKIILICTTLILLTSSALAFQGTGEPNDLPRQQYSKMATTNNTDSLDVPNGNLGDDHEVHFEEEGKPNLRRRVTQRVSK